MKEVVIESPKNARDQLWERVEPGLLIRMKELREIFRKEFGEESLIQVRSPGRAEIIGNHTDYNNGYALGCAIPQSVVALFSPRSDSLLHVMSKSYPSERQVVDLNNLVPGAQGTWMRYISAVAAEIKSVKTDLHGANIYIDTTVPSTGGLSSSAAFEVGIAMGLMSLNNIEMSKMDLARLCQRAENGPFVQVPCGILDQASVLLSNRDELVFIDFSPKGNDSFTTQAIPALLGEHGLSFVLTIDPSAQRRLGETAYSKRTKTCEDSIKVLQHLLQKPITSLRDVSVTEFEEVRIKLDFESPEMRRRVEHVVYENDRVIQAVLALTNKRFIEFGQLLTASGRSALHLYDLAEGTPELLFLYDTASTMHGVLGTRNMGGGFSAVTLSLIQLQHAEKFQSSLQNTYNKLYRRSLEFIVFEPSSGASLL